MKILMKTALLVLLPSTLALASNPSECIKPGNLREAALTGIIHNVEHAISPKDIKLNRWYSVGKGNYYNDMILLSDKSNHWANGQIGYKDDKGVLCDYVTTSSPLRYVDIQKFYKRPYTVK